jgi:hypothetical protein
MSNKHRYGDMVARQSNPKQKEFGNATKGEMEKQRTDLRKRKLRKHR